MELVLLVVGVVVVLAGGVVALALSVRSRRARKSVETTAQLNELERTAGSALVAADERIALAESELDFAGAEFGDEAVRSLRATVTESREKLREAFHLNQLLSDEHPDTETERRDWNQRIITVAESAIAPLRAAHDQLSDQREAARNAPDEIARVRSDLVQVRSMVAPAQQVLEALGSRYSATALLSIATNPEQAEQLLSFTDRSIEVATQRLASGRHSDVTPAITAAIETVRRARLLLAAVESFEVEALKAESTLGAVLEDSIGDVAEAQKLRSSPEAPAELDRAIGELQREIREASDPEARRDPLSALNELRDANTQLDTVVARMRDSEARDKRTRVLLLAALDDADQQITGARRLITDYSGSVRADARTRLSEAERDIATITEERDPELALRRARRAASLAAEASAIARADIEQSSYNSGGYGQQGYGQQGYGRQRGGGGSLVTGVLGGMLLGGMLDNFGDMGDIFD